MTPIRFKEANRLFGPPPDLSDSQCNTIYAFQGKVEGGSVDGAALVVTAWRPSAEELEAINKGAPIFLSVIGGLPPHFICTDFQQAINPV